MLSARRNVFFGGNEVANMENMQQAQPSIALLWPLLLLATQLSTMRPAAEISETRVRPGEEL